MKEEIVPVVDTKDKIIGMVSRKEMREKNIFHRIAHVVVFNSNGRIFVHRRTFKKDIYPGFYDMLIGGVVAKGETYHATAQRELQEELGIKAKLHFLFKIKYEDKENKVFAKVYKCITGGLIRIQVEEILHGKFMEIQEVQKLLKKEKFPKKSIMIFDKYLTSLK